MPFLPPNQQRQSTEGKDTDLRLKDEILVVTGAVVKTLSKAEN